MMAEQLGKELDAFGSDSIIVLVLNVKQYFYGILNAMRILTNERGLAGIYITVNKPQITLQEQFRDYGIDTSKLFFIDAITETVEQPKTTAQNVIYLPNPQSLTDISLALNEAATHIKAPAFVFLDSISTLLIYNDTENIAKFAHFLTLKLRALRMKGVLAAVRQQLDEELINELTQYCDKVVDLSEESVEFT